MEEGVWGAGRGWGGVPYRRTVAQQLQVRLHVQTYCTDGPQRISRDEMCVHGRLACSDLDWWCHHIDIVLCIALPGWGAEAGGETTSLNDTVRDAQHPSLWLASLHLDLSVYVMWIDLAAAEEQRQCEIPHFGFISIFFSCTSHSLGSLPSQHWLGEKRFIVLLESAFKVLSLLKTQVLYSIV